MLAYPTGMLSLCESETFPISLSLQDMMTDIYILPQGNILWWQTKLLSPLLTRIQSQVFQQCRDSAYIVCRQFSGLPESVVINRGERFKPLPIRNLN